MIVSTFTETSVREILDIDEEAYRKNELNIGIKVLSGYHDFKMMKIV